jgi:hypothetical protein
MAKVVTSGISCYADILTFDKSPDQLLGLFEAVLQITADTHTNLNCREIIHLIFDNDITRKTHHTGTG